MKRIVTLFLVFTTCFSLCACKNKKVVELTVDNINDYLALKFDFSSVEHKKDSYDGNYWHYTEFIFESYAVKNGTFNDATVTVQVILSEGWIANDSSENVKNNKIISTFKVPSNGSYDETYHFFGTPYCPLTKVTDYAITAVSGTFVMD